MVDLQRQMCQQLEAAQVSLSTPHVTESSLRYSMDAKMKLLIVGFSVSLYTLSTEKYRAQVTRQLLNWLFTFLGQQKHFIIIFLVQY